MAKFVVDTKLARFAVETNPPICGRVERYPAVPRPTTVDVTCESKKNTKLDPNASNVLVSCESKKLVETKLARLAVDTRDVRLAVEIRDARLAVEIRDARLAVETSDARFAVETKFAKLTGTILEIYPAVPRPITVDVS